MKTIYTLILSTFLAVTGLTAQMPIWVFEDSLQLGSTVLPGFSVTIPECEYDKTLKSWKKTLESGTKSKVITENGQMSIFGANIKDLSSNPVNVYSRLMRKDTVIQLTASFELKKDQYIEKSAVGSELSRAEVYMKGFAKDQYSSLVKDQLDTEKKKLRSLEREYKSLGRNKKSEQRSIQANRKNIKNAQNDMHGANNELAGANSNLRDQNSQYARLTTGNNQEERMEYKKEQDKRKKKAQKAIKSSRNKINRSNNRIMKSSANIPKIERKQDNIQEKVMQQEEVVQRYVNKLNTIKSY